MTFYTFNPEALHTLCNAAIEWHIAQQAAPTLCTNEEWLANCPQKVRDFDMDLDAAMSEAALTKMTEL